MAYGTEPESERTCFFPPFYYENRCGDLVARLREYVDMDTLLISHLGTGFSKGEGRLRGIVCLFSRPGYLFRSPFIARSSDPHEAFYRRRKFRDRWRSSDTLTLSKAYLIHSGQLANRSTMR